MEYFIVQNGQQQGPFTIDQLRTMGINANTPVWAQGFSEWTKAGSVVELQSILIPVPPINGIPSRPSYQQVSQNIPPMPEAGLGWAIAATLLCCMPFGIVAIIYATKVSSLYHQGRYEEAENASQKAKTWTWVSAISGIVFLVLYFALIVGGIIGFGSLSRY